eukprot:6205023-Pleurochrysis_carterae.AAC.2
MPRTRRALRLGLLELLRLLLRLLLLLGAHVRLLLRVKQLQHRLSIVAQHLALGHLPRQHQLAQLLADARQVALDGGAQLLLLQQTRAGALAFTQQPRRVRRARLHLRALLQNREALLEK